MKQTLIWIIAILIIWFGIWSFVQNTHAPAVPEEITQTPTPLPPPSSKLPANMSASDMIEVSVPSNNSLVQSPIAISGRARGPWYFEASFPIELRNSSNIVIGTGIAQAQGDWMTENWVPFTASLTFPAQTAGTTGTLVFKNDNPSWLPENEKSIVIPVQF